MAKLHGFDERGARRVVRAVKGFESQARGKIAVKPRPRLPIMQPRHIWLPYLNDTGGTIPAGAILKVKNFDTETESFRVEQYDQFGAVYPTAVNALEDVADNQPGILTFTFPAPVLYDDTDTPAFGESWGPVSGEWDLKQDSVGFTVIGIESSADKTVWVNTSENIDLIGQFDGVGTVAANASATASIYRFSSGVWTDTTYNVTARNTTPSAITKGDRIAIHRTIGEEWVAHDFSTESILPEFVNNSGAIVPAYGFLRITGFNGTRYTADKSNSLGSFGLAAVNTGLAVAIGANGNLSFTFPNWVLYDTGDTPVVGQQWGPVNASWEVELDSLGFVIIGGATSGRVLVARSDNFTFLGQFGSSVTANETGTFTLYKFSGASWATTGHTTTARNVSDVTIDSGVHCSGYYLPNDGQALVLPIHCS